MLILAATNPTIDRIVTVPQLQVSQVHRATALELSAGGKAINVARAARNIGVKNQLTVGFLAGFSGQHLDKLMADEGLPCCWHRVSNGETKMSHLLMHESADATVINEPGPALSKADWQAYTELLEEKARKSRAVVFAGTIPPGVPVSEYASLCRRLAGTSTQVFIDTPGATLEAILNDPAGYAIKINRAELSQAWGRDLDTTDKLIAAIREIIDLKVRMIGITLGADGAIVADRTGIYRTGFTPRSPRFVSTVGSGDSFTAGLVTAYLRGSTIDEGLHLAAACGMANVESARPAQFSAERVQNMYDMVRVEKLL